MILYSSLADAPANLLRRLAEHAIAGNLPEPWDQRALAELRLAELWPTVSVFRGLSAVALEAVLLAILRERSIAQASCSSLVWTGPDVPNSQMRDTWMVIEELFTSAEHEVLVAGYTFDHGQELFEAVRSRMISHKVSCHIIMDVRPPPTGVSLEKHLEHTALHFQQEIWCRGAPWPRLYYDTRTCAPKSRVSMHAKCIVVDSRRCLIGSANFTDRGRKRNTELGLLMDCETTAMQVSQQFRWLMANDLIKALA